MKEVKIVISEKTVFFFYLLVKTINALTEIAIGVNPITNDDCTKRNDIHKIETKKNNY